MIVPFQRSHRKTAMTPRELLIALDFLRAANDNRVRIIGCTDSRMARENNWKELPGGKLQYGEGAGVPVIVYGLDSLGNTVALCKDGCVRQFMGD